MKRWMRLGLAATIATTVVTSMGSGVDARSRSDLETYTSPTFGVTLEYDTSIWSEFQNTEADAQNPGDILGLETDGVAGGLVFDFNDRQTDADDCLEEVVAYGVGDADDVEPIEDEDGEPIEGSSRGSAYAAYTFVSEQSNYVGAYFGCQEFGDELGVVAYMLFVDSRDFDEGYELIQPIIESVDDADAHAANEGDSDDRDRDDEDEEDKDDRDRDEEEENEDAGADAESGVYESELYGYTLPYNADTWTPELQETDGTTEAFRLNGPRNEDLTVLTFAAEGARPIDYTEFCVESFGEQHDVDIELYEDPESGDTLERSNRTESYALYSFERDGDEFLLYLHAMTSEDGRFVVLVTGLALESSYDLFQEDVFPLLDRIEYE